MEGYRKDLPKRSCPRNRTSACAPSNVLKTVLVPRSHTLKTLAQILGLSFEDFMKSAQEQDFAISQREPHGLTRPQRTVLSVGICLIILMLSFAYVVQSPNFPETTFELLVFLSTALALMTVVLFVLWRKNA